MTEREIVKLICIVVCFYSLLVTYFHFIKYKIKNLFVVVVLRWLFDLEIDTEIIIDFLVIALDLGILHVLAYW